MEPGQPQRSDLGKALGPLERHLDSTEDLSESISSAQSAMLSREDQGSNEFPMEHTNTTQSTYKLSPEEWEKAQAMALYLSDQDLRSMLRKRTQAWLEDAAMREGQAPTMKLSEGMTDQQFKRIALAEAKAFAEGLNKAVLEEEPLSDGLTNALGKMTAAQFEKLARAQAEIMAEGLRAAARKYQTSDLNGEVPKTIG